MGENQRDQISSLCMLNQSHLSGEGEINYSLGGREESRGRWASVIKPVHPSLKRQRQTSGARSFIKGHSHLQELLELGQYLQAKAVSNLQHPQTIHNDPGFAIQPHAVQCNRTVCEGCQALLPQGKISCSPAGKEPVQFLGTKSWEAEHDSGLGSSEATAYLGTIIGNYVISNFSGAVSHGI